MRLCQRCQNQVKVVRDSDDHTEWVCDKCYFNKKEVKLHNGTTKDRKTNNILQRIGK